VEVGAITLTLNMNKSTNTAVNRKPGLLQLFILCMILLFLQGCASTSIFKPYPGQMQEMINDVNQSGKLSIEKPETQRGPDQVLHYLEQGRLAQITQQYDLSKAYFDLAIDYFEQLDYQARISATKLSQQGSSLLVNDNVITYDPPAFEQLYVHHFQALNYLFAKDLDAAGVEVRRANLVQTKIQEKNAAEIDKANKKASELPVSIGPTQEYIDALYRDTDSSVSRLKNSFQNGYAFYASAIIYELRGEWGDAFIDYKNALEVNPDNRFIQRDVQRLAKRLGYQEDYDSITKKIGPLPAPAAAPQKAPAEVVIFYEDGFVPAKRDVTIPITNFYDRAIAISFPVYEDSYTPPHTLTVSANSNNSPTTSAPLSNTYALAIKALQEQQFSLIVRQISRAITKAELTHKSEQAGGSLGAVLASVYNIVSEQADLRSWLSLPRRAEVIRMTLPAETRSITFKPEGSALSRSMPLKLEPNSITVIQVTHTGSQLFTRAVTFNRN